MHYKRAWWSLPGLSVILMSLIRLVVVVINVSALVIAQYKDDLTQFAEELKPFVDEYFNSLSVKLTCCAVNLDCLLIWQSAWLPLPCSTYFCLLFYKSRWVLEASIEFFFKSFPSFEFPWLKVLQYKTVVTIIMI